jgi:MoxR-like ATPase
MAGINLTTDDGLRAACASLGSPDKWGADGSEWVPLLAGTITWVRSASETERGTRDFQKRLWEDNHVAAVGQGRISVDRALDDAGFRDWLAARSMVPLPSEKEERLHFLTSFYGELKAKLEPFIDQKVPHLKIFRVMAAIYPEGMTTIASIGALVSLTRAMGAKGPLESVERHLWVRDRLDAVIGPVSGDPILLAGRISLPWMLYERFVQTPSEVTEKPTAGGTDSKLLPLPAARRRRGLTAIRGLFPGVLSTLEFVRDGATRAELLDFLRASSPESKVNTLGMAINVLKSELAVIRDDGDRYVLTERGVDVLESQDPSHLADWLLTRILGPDKALAELRDRGPLKTAELVAAIRAMNPGWTADFAPQGIVSWLRSLGLIEPTPDYRYALTAAGKEWASHIYWTPEPLPTDPPPAHPPVDLPTPTDGDVALPALPMIIASVQQAGYFPDAQIAQLHAGLWAHQRRHFAILTGLSGAGKTLLARSYAAALAKGEADQRLFTLPVQPGWYDPGALLGYVNPLRREEFVRTPFLDFLIRVAADPTSPHVAVLDEMNLSHPEQYMAPLLSAMETGDAIQLHAEGDNCDGVPARLPYPKNLALIGTVNMDETTHGLSDKVLDRAFVLEFWHVDLDAYPRWGRKAISPAAEQRARQVLTALMKALAPARLHFGWRVVDEVLDFLAKAAPSGAALPADAALDAVIYGKVLPKLRGEDGPRFREALSKCEAALGDFGLERSKAKVSELRIDLETTGSARFWR